MTKLNITEAAKAAGISRPTFYRHIKDGKVSVEKGSDGETRIDLSEILRVYGEAQPIDPPRDTTEPDKEVQPEKDSTHPAVEKYITHLEAEVHALRDEHARLVGVIEHQTRLLTYQPPEVPVAASKETTEDPPPHPDIEDLKEQVARIAKQNKYLNYKLHMEQRSFWEKLIGKKYVEPVDR